MFFPETKGRSLEAIAESFGDKVVFADDTASQQPVSDADDKKADVEQLEVAREV